MPQKLFIHFLGLIVYGTVSCLPLVEWQIDTKVQCFGQVCSFSQPRDLVNSRDNKEGVWGVCVHVCVITCKNDVSYCGCLSIKHIFLYHKTTTHGDIWTLILTAHYHTKAWISSTYTLKHAETRTHTHTLTHTQIHIAGFCSSWQLHLSSQYFLLFGLWVTDPADFTGLCSLSRSIPFNFIGAKASYYIIEFGLIMRAEQSPSTCDLLRWRADHLLLLLTFDSWEYRFTPLINFSHKYSKKEHPSKNWKKLHQIWTSN